MPKAYDNDLRRKVIEAIELHGMKRVKPANTLGLAANYPSMVSTQIRHGDVKPKPTSVVVIATDDGVTTPSAAMPDGKWNDLRSLKNALSLSISLT
jgi:hypothetical protein